MNTYSFKKFVQEKDRLMEYGYDVKEWGDVVEKIVKDMENMENLKYAKWFSSFLRKYPQVKARLNKVADLIVRHDPKMADIDRLQHDRKMQLDLAMQTLEVLANKIKNLKPALKKFVDDQEAKKLPAVSRLAGKALSAGIGTAGAIARGVSRAGDVISKGVEGVKAAPDAIAHGINNAFDVVLADPAAKIGRFVSPYVQPFLDEVEESIEDFESGVRDVATGAAMMASRLMGGPTPPDPGQKTAMISKMA